MIEIINRLLHPVKTLNTMKRIRIAKRYLAHREYRNILGGRIAANYRRTL